MRGRRGIDGFEVCVLAAFAGISVWLVAVNLRLAATHGLTWTGIDGVFPVDQMQYLAWVKDASRHLLVSDLFTFRPTPHDYLQPMVAASGGLTAVGVAPWLALLVWKPVAVAAIFFAVRGYTRRLFDRRGECRAALVLALFAAFFGTRGDEWLPFMSWGYVFGLVAVAALVAALVAYDRSCRSGRFSVLPGTFGLLAGWLHPWQGEILILVILASELVHGLGPRERARARRLPLPAFTVAAAALPLLYYEVLKRGDPAWRLAASVTQRHPATLAAILLPLLPLGLAAVPAYRRPARSFLQSATRLWPLAALAVWAIETAGFGPGGTPRLDGDHDPASRAGRAGDANDRLRSSARLAPARGSRGPGAHHPRKPPLDQGLEPLHRPGPPQPESQHALRAAGAGLSRP